jgi:hypothetical protein
MKRPDSRASVVTAEYVVSECGFMGSSLDATWFAQHGGLPRRRVVAFPHQRREPMQLNRVLGYARSPFFGAGSTRSFRRYEPGESIVDYLDQTDEVFFIISGGMRVTIYSLAGKAVSFRELGPGEVFGEYPAIDRGPRSASVEAHTACLVATLDGSRGDPRVEASNHCVTR